MPKELVFLLRGYSFPGNIRELEGMIFDALVRHESHILSLESFKNAIGDRSAGGRGEPGIEEGENLFTERQALPTIKDSIDMLIEEAMRRAEGNQASAARILGLTRTALNRRLNRNT